MKGSLKNCAGRFQAALDLVNQLMLQKFFA